MAFRSWKRVQIKFKLFMVAKLKLQPHFPKMLLCFLWHIFD